MEELFPDAFNFQVHFLYNDAYINEKGHGEHKIIKELVLKDFEVSNKMKTNSEILLSEETLEDETS
jgi:hypothetical protein